MKRYGDLQIGLTVLVAMIILVGGVLWFKGFQAHSDTYTLTVYFPQASGLDRGDPVEVAGVVQGKVDELQYEKGRAKLVLSINQGAELYRDAAVAIANFGMMGQKFIAIDPGTPQAGPLDTSLPMEGEFQPGVGDMMTEVGQSLKATNLLVERLNKFLAVIDSTGGAESISRTLTHVDQITGDLAAVTAGNRESLKRSIANFEAASGELRALLVDKGPQLRGTLDNMSAATARADSLTRTLGEVSLQLKELMAKAQSPDGNVGALLEDRQLYDRLVGTVARTDSLLLDFQANPRKYLKFSVF